MFLETSLCPRLLQIGMSSIFKWANKRIRGESRRGPAIKMDEASVQERAMLDSAKHRGNAERLRGQINQLSQRKNGIITEMKMIRDNPRIGEAQKKKMLAPKMQKLTTVDRSLKDLKTTYQQVEGQTYAVENAGVQREMLGLLYEGAQMMERQQKEPVVGSGKKALDVGEVTEYVQQVRDDQREFESTLRGGLDELSSADQAEAGDVDDKLDAFMKDSSALEEGMYVDDFAELAEEGKGAEGATESTSPGDVVERYIATEQMRSDLKRIGNIAYRNAIKDGLTKEEAKQASIHAIRAEGYRIKQRQDQVTMEHIEGWPVNPTHAAASKPPTTRAPRQEHSPDMRVRGENEIIHEIIHEEQRGHSTSAAGSAEDAATPAPQETRPSRRRPAQRAQTKPEGGGDTLEDLMYA